MQSEWVCKRCAEVKKTHEQLKREQVGKHCGVKCTTCPNPVKGSGDRCDTCKTAARIVGQEATVVDSRGRLCLCKKCKKVQPIGYFPWVLGESSRRKMCQVCGKAMVEAILPELSATELAAAVAAALADAREEALAETSEGDEPDKPLKKRQRPPDN
jgi:hypothetical protein